LGIYKSGKMGKNSYCTIIEAISDLQGRGFYFDFSLIENKLFRAQEQRHLEADEFDWPCPAGSGVKNTVS
jgi:hypothetical protein